MTGRAEKQTPRFSRGPFRCGLSLGASRAIELHSQFELFLHLTADDKVPALS